MQAIAINRLEGWGLTILRVVVDLILSPTEARSYSAKASEALRA